MLNQRQQRELVRQLRATESTAADLGSKVSSEFRSRATTADGTQTTLHTFTVPAGTTYAIEAHVVARRTGGSSGTAEDGAYYVLRAVYKNVSGAATIIGSVGQTIVGEAQGGWDATLDTSGGTVRVRVTGAANNNVVWFVRATVTSVAT